MAFSIKENAMLNDKTLISRSIDFENETTEEQRAIRDVMALVKKSIVQHLSLQTRYKNTITILSMSLQILS